jgi:hypothetical protein
LKNFQKKAVLKQKIELKEVMVYYSNHIVRKKLEYYIKLYRLFGKKLPALYEDLSKSINYIYHFIWQIIFPHIIVFGI